MSVVTHGLPVSPPKTVKAPTPLPKTIRIMAKSGNGEHAIVTTGDGSPMPVYAVEADIRIRRDELITAVVKVAVIDAEILANASFVCECPHCGKPIAII